MKIAETTACVLLVGAAAALLLAPGAAIAMLGAIASGLGSITFPIVLFSMLSKCAGDDLPKSTEKSRLYCFGDIHGELDGFKENLTRAHLIDPDGNWNAIKQTTLIHVGDVIDRGPKSTEAYAYLQRLQEQAQQHAGKVVRLLGNHELMLVQNYFNHEPLNCDGKLLDQNLAQQIITDIKNGNVQGAYCEADRFFVHGGLRSGIKSELEKEIRKKKQMPEYKPTLQDIVDHINKQLIDAVTRQTFDHFIFNIPYCRGGEDPVGGVFWTDYGELLESPRAKNTRQIVGHTTPHDNEPAIRFGHDALVCVDAGLFEGYGGHKAFLKIKPDRTIRVYEKLSNGWTKEARTKDGRLFNTESK